MIKSINIKNFKKMKKLIYVLLAFVLFLSFSCSNSSSITNPTAISKGNITLKLTDATPMHFDQFVAINITIDSIELGNNADPSSFVTILDQPTTYNMLDLVNGNTDVLANIDIPEGQYNTLRIYIASTEIVLKDGTNFKHEIDQSFSIGLGNFMGGNMNFNNNNGSIDVILDHPIDIKPGDLNEYLMDLDVNHSFTLDGVSFDNVGMGGLVGFFMHITGFSFNPTFRFVDLSQTGTISGTVHSDQGDLANVTIILKQGNHVYTATHTNADGHYQFIGIPNGTYEMEAEIEGYTLSATGNDANMGDIVMADKANLTVDFNMTKTN